MFRQLAILAVLAACALAHPIEKYEDIPEEYKKLIPAEVAEHIKSVTPEEKEILKELAKRHDEFKTEDDFLAALKEKSPSLHEKASKLHQMLKTKVDALGAEAKAFVEAVIAEARKVHAAYLAGNKPALPELKAMAKKHIDAFTKLSDASKEEFKTQFPILTKVFTNPQIKALADKYLEN